MAQDLLPHTVHDLDNITVEEAAVSQTGDIIWLVAMCLLPALLITATAVGNLFVMAAIVRDKRLGSPSNYLVFSLALADLLVALLVMPPGAVYQAKERWTLGPALCDLWTSCDVLCCTASILHLLAIAVDRYWAVTNVEYARNRCKKRIYAAIALVWMISFAISIAPVFGWKDPDFDRRVEIEGRCLVSQDLGYQVFATFSSFYVPLVMILVLYWRIFLQARKRIRRRPGVTSLLVQRPLLDEKLGFESPSCVVDTTLSCTLDSASSRTDASNEQTGEKGRKDHPGEDGTHNTAPSSFDYPSSRKDMREQISEHDLTMREVMCKTVSSNPDSAGRTDKSCEHNGERKELPGRERVQKVMSSPLDSPSSRKGNRYEETGEKEKRELPIREGIGKTVSCPLDSPSGKTDLSGVPIGVKEKKDLPRGGRIRKTLSSRKDTASVLRHGGKKEKSSSAKREKKAAKTLAIITGVFVACWLPFFVVALLQPLCGSDSPLFGVFLWLGWANSALNPLIYTLFSPDFRNAFRKMLCPVRSSTT